MKTRNLLNVAAIAIAIVGACSESDIISEESEIKTPKKPTEHTPPLLAGFVQVHTKSGLNCMPVTVSLTACHEAPTGMVCTMIYNDNFEPVYATSGSMCGNILRRIQ